MNSNDASLARGRGISPFGRVVVGFDGTPSSSRAVMWAAREAELRGAELHVLSNHTAEARDTLINEAYRADLLVLAIGDAGSGSAALRGSVARTASRTSPCPVVVVRGDWAWPTRRIVVGWDSSSASVAGLMLAADAAALHDCELVVAHVREPHCSTIEAECIVNFAVNECKDHRLCNVTGVLLEGQPSTALADISGDADLLVIGSRGRSGFKTLLFGSVAEALVDSAACPVLVTHPKARQAP